MKTAAHTLPSLLLASFLCASGLVALRATEPRPVASPPPAVVLDDVKLVGELAEGRATFILTATARVENSQGGTIDLLSGPVALTEAGSHPQWHLRAGQNRFTIAFDHRGKFPLRFKFDAAVRQNDGWQAVDFRVAPSPAAADRDPGARRGHPVRVSRCRPGLNASGASLRPSSPRTAR